MYELILQSSTIGIILAIFMSCAMLVAINSPLWVFFIYILIRPLLFPYTQLQYTFFGLPLSAFPSLVLLIGAIKFSLLSKHGTLFIKNMNSLYLLLFIMLLSSFNSYNHSISFHFIVQYITAISLAVIAYNAVNKIEDFIILYKMIAVSSILPILFGLYEKYVVGINRIASVMAMENEYGIYLSLIIVVLIFLIINEKKNIYKLIWCSIMSLAVFSLLLSLNRGSWIALSFSLFFAGIIFFPYVHIRWYFFIGIIIIITSLTLIMDRFDELNEFTPWGTSKNTFSGRIDHWMQLIDIAFQRFYLGWGPGTSRVVSNDLLSFNFVPHNDYLRLFLETGILGPLIFLFLIIKNIILAIFSSRDFGKWKIHYTILVIITYFFIIALPQNIIANVMLFPLFLALLASYNKIRTCFN